MSSRNAWTRFSERYEDLVFSVTSSPARRQMFAREIRGPKVLNMGTGPLPFMNSDLIKLGHTVVASDFSAAMLDASQHVLRHPRLTYVRADNRHLPFMSGSFDTILTINSVLPADRQEIDLMLSEVHRVLRPEGRLVGFFPAWETSIKARDRLSVQETLDFEAFRVYETTGWQCYQTHETLVDHLKRAGFADPTVRRVLLKSSAEIRSMKSIYGVDTSSCLMFEHLALATR